MDIILIHAMVCTTRLQLTMFQLMLPWLGFNILGIFISHQLYDQDFVITIQLKGSYNVNNIDL